MVTISDVAHYCKVNESTVSRVLHGSKKISTRTTARVLQAVSELGYTPIRKSKVRRHSDEIILVMPNPSLYTLGTTVKDITLTLHEVDYDIRIVNLHHHREITPEIATTLCRKNAAGIILYGCTVPEEAAAVFYEQHMPAIVQQGRTSNLVSISVNNYNGMRDAVNYVISRGYKKIGFVGWKPPDFNIKERTDSFHMVMQEAGLDDSMQFFENLNIEGGYLAMEKMLDQYSPDAIVFSADILAYGGIKYANEHGIRYPEDIGLMGFDDAYLSEVLGLTTMYQLLEEKVKQVVENLLVMIEHKSVSPAKEILLTPRLVIRDSLR